MQWGTDQKSVFQLTTEKKSLSKARQIKPAKSNVTCNPILVIVVENIQVYVPYLKRHTATCSITDMNTKPIQFT